ncbi:hypothetical protein OPV22_012085 [Ensete ventricosum]|uniref:Uncharacterized protein n=1 Tax=Ensete ventricosum TaxID=4639 RepID=A0AAV8QXR1_ENSVE|nr:hypothetical protein OPV22_012085 [Ensete ventricosum]
MRSRPLFLCGPAPRRRSRNWCTQLIHARVFDGMRKRGWRELDGAFITKSFYVSRMATGGAGSRDDLDLDHVNGIPSCRCWGRGPTLHHRAVDATTPRKAAVDNGRNCGWRIKRWWCCDSEMACCEFSVQYSDPKGLRAKMMHNTQNPKRTQRLLLQNATEKAQKVC